MSEPSADIVAEWAEEDASNQGFRPLREVVTASLATRLPGKSAEERAELCEKLIPAIIRSLETRVAEDRAEGIASSFELSVEGDSASGANDAYFRVLEAPEIPLLTQLRFMEPKKLEELCAQILQNLGGKAAVTGGSDDDGVDFVAVNLQLGERVRFAPRASQALVIGQAKRYKAGRNIKPTEMREFIGGAVLRAEQLRRANSFDAGVLTPVVFAYWTTSDFHHDARRYAREMGIWYLNGIGLTQLALRAGVKPE